jgi:hypothetical protein
VVPVHHPVSSEPEDSGHFNNEDDSDEMVLAPGGGDAAESPADGMGLDFEEDVDGLEQRTITVGFHHGHLNPLPASWQNPKGRT